MAEDLGERTEQPTERRLDEARDKGQVARSTDLSAAVTLTAAVLAMLLLAGLLARSLAGVMRAALGEGILGEGFTAAALVAETATLTSTVARPLLPLMLLLCAAAFIGSVAQVGWRIAPRALEPKWNKLNVVKGMKNLLSRRSVVKGCLDVLKFTIIAAVVVFILRSRTHEVLALANLAPAPALARAAWLALELALWVLAILVLLGLLDFRYQKWQHNEDLKMTRHEVRQERKDSDGDAETKARRLRLARQVALQRVGIDVPRADVVVTNPTHYAVALRYDPASGMRAPKVVAKGADYLALRMRYIAAASGVPVVERPPLARALYASVPVGREVHPEHYEAVAEVLAYVYRLNERVAV